MIEREKIIKYNKAFVKKNSQIPPTSLEYYKFVKVRTTKIVLIFVNS